MAVPEAQVFREHEHNVYWGKFFAGAALLKLTAINLLGAAAFLLAPGCATATGQPADRELVVFAASSLTDAFLEMAREFEARNPGVKIVLNFAGSQRLRTQLEHGAQAGLFASADWGHAEAIAAGGLAHGGPIGFATNRLAVITPSKSEGVKTLNSLAGEGVKLVVAHPSVPAGAYTREAVNNLGAKAGYGKDYTARVLGNVVSEEPNVRRVAQKVALGDADAGIVYWSDAHSPDIARRVKVTAIPEDCNVAAEYPAILLRTAQRAETAQRFLDYLLSPEGQETLQRHGFGPRVGAATDSTALPARP